jgi:hypothetical protein
MSEAADVMTQTEAADVLGPIDFLLLEFHSDRLTGRAGGALLDLVEQGIIRIFDLLVIQKHDDGTFSGLDIADMTADHLGGFAVFSGARSGLVGDDDVAEAAAAMEPGTTAAMLVYENTWARPFVAAARDAGAQVIASERIPADVVMDVLDALEAADAAD